MNRSSPGGAAALAAPSPADNAAASGQAAERRAPPGDSRGTRFADLTPSTYDAAARTVEVVLSAGSPVRRYGFTEELEISAAAIDLSRVTAGHCRLLDAHNQWSVHAILGSVLSARIEGKQLVGVVSFADTEQGRLVEGMVARGELTSVSIGYRVTSWTMVNVDEAGHETWRAGAWELFEASFVPVPADAAAGVRSAVLSPGLNGAPAASQEENDMNRSTPGGAPAPAHAAAAPAPAVSEAEAARAAPAPAAAAEPAAPAADANAVRMSAGAAMDFAEDCRLLGVDATQARAWADSMTPDAARAQLSRHAAEAQRTRAPTPALGAARITHDERDTMRSAITDALLNRANPNLELSEPGREFRGMTLLEIVRRNLERNGEKTTGMGKRELADMAFRQHSTSDFPNVLSNVANRTLRNGYDAAPQTFKAWQRRASVSDFKQVTRLQMGGAPSFLLVPEGGQFKFGTIGEGKEVYALATYGRRFSITRQVLINDDLDAFTRIPTMWGRAAADFESDAAYAPLIANPNMGDGVALFHANHGNLAVSGAVPGEATWSGAEQAFAAQTGIEGRPISVQPKFMIVSPKDKVAALKLRGSDVSQGASATAGTTNVYQNAFNVIVEARLSRTSGATPWFAAADYNQVDTVEYAYLDGDDGVFLDERIGFDVDGIEYKARLDFAVKAIDYRGLWQNPGTT